MQSAPLLHFWLNPFLFESIFRRWDVAIEGKTDIETRRLPAPGPTRRRPKTSTGPHSQHLRRHRNSGRALTITSTEHLEETHATLRELGPQDVIEGHELVFLAFLAGIIAGLGLAYKGASAAVKGWLGTGANVWDNSGLENIALDVFSKRSQEPEQTVHELVMREGIR
jgi:hypothetical protein